jgi:hypothetical protein
MMLVELQIRAEEESTLGKIGLADPYGLSPKTLIAKAAAVKLGACCYFRGEYDRCRYPVPPLGQWAALNACDRLLTNESLHRH